MHVLCSSSHTASFLAPTQKLPPGRYSYKFIVDGVWQHSPLDPTISDGAGGFNNILVIEGEFIDSITALVLRINSASKALDGIYPYDI